MVQRSYPGARMELRGAGGIVDYVSRLWHCLAALGCCVWVGAEE